MSLPVKWVSVISTVHIGVGELGNQTAFCITNVTFMTSRLTKKNNEILHLKGNSSYCKRVIYVHLLLDVCPRPAAFSTTTQTCHQCELSTTLYECTFAISRNLCCVNHAIKLLVALLARNYSYSPPPLKQKSTPPPSICDMTIKFANLVLERLFITNLYQLDKQSSKFTI